ncbi:putative LacI-family transcriptional regulator [Actinoplanes missouriensis 431]|uniref:Putative LacI-family transcriptional regulator n=1 Tax=Actinoplanes missouriensis (strain ATCC 14538 / DSM 43046 / CBS 188.64 / JCM 3121 / NBRC 102363 / NCIMB 12654 / NRRL B-3342 / UNCC 431) TaxID=512565 RepID=I0GZR3_ACTM4|nr:LacI family DNA-binding transcriptional regulator [Actinoplanes missouriensis]BAL86250.1 putative LacI-family transcriptional regulator [Actinoplanes missouriensis 431]
MPRVTLQTIADRVGVSRMTVSNAFSRPDQLSPALRERILAAAQDLGYVGPDPTARALAKGTTGAVGILLTDSLRYAFTDLVAGGFLAAIAGELAPTGLAITLLTSAAAGDVVPARDVAIDGAVVYSCDPTSPAVSWLRRRNLPMVFVDQDQVDDVASVNIADRAGARAAAQHLIDLGHRRFAIAMNGENGRHGFITDPSTLIEGHASHQRRLGWSDVLEPAGVKPAFLRHPLEKTEDVRRDARVLLAAEDRPTAFLCFSDTTAVGVRQAAEDLRLRVPEDLSIVGFDDGPDAVRMQPALTTVRQDVVAKGQAAAAALTEAIRRSRGGPAGPVPHIMLPTELVIRDSSGPAPRTPV